MRKIIVGFICVCLFGTVGFTQLTTSYHNVFKDVSVYKNKADVYLGNYGLAKYSLLNPFIDNNTQLHPVFFTQSDSATYTNLFTTLGLGKEGVVKVAHHQQFGDNLKLNLSYFRASSIGFYQKQTASLANLKGNLKFKSRNKKYNANFFLRNYTRKNELNGGIRDSLFKALSAENIAGTSFPIQLNTANLEKKLQVYDFTHSYSFKQHDSLTSGFKLRQQLNCVREKYRYTDIENGFYDTSFIDSTASNDSMKIEYLTNNVSLVYDLNKTTIFYLGISNSYADYKANDAFIPSMIHSALFGGSYAKNKFSISSRGSYTFSGFLSGNYNNTFSATYYDTNYLFNKVSGNLSVGKYTPYLYYYLYSSNRYKWDVNLTEEDVITLNAKAKSNKLGLTLTGKLDVRNNTVYFDSVFTPKQTNTVFFNLGASKEFKVAKWLVWQPTVYYQHINANTGIDVPNFYTTNRLYAQGKLFKKVLAFKIGVDVLYYTNFYAKAYNPSFDHFYVQQNEQAGNYPFIDVFAEFYLKNNIAFFIKSEHVNSGFTGTNYLASPTYRQQDRTIKGGIKWRLYN